MDRWIALMMIVATVVAGVIITVSSLRPDPSVECFKAGGQWEDTNSSFVVNMGCVRP